MHIKKFHLTKFQLYRCPLCGFDAATYQDLRAHWRKRHELFTPLLKPDVECVSQPYESVPACRTCGYQTLIPYALDLHSCEQLPVIRNDVMLVEREVKCEHAQDVKYSYGLGAPASICVSCLHQLISDPDMVKFEKNVFKIHFTQTLTRDDAQFQAQKALLAAEKTQRVGMGPGLSVSKRRLQDHSCSDLVTGIDIRERYFCVVHAKEFPSAEALVQHNYSLHQRLHITEAYRCFVCAYDGANFSLTKRHALRYHKDECSVDNTLFIVKVTVTGYPKIPICKTCGFASMDSEIFQEHGCFSWKKSRTAPATADAEANGGAHVCSECHAAFVTSEQLQAHVDDAHTRWMRIYRCFACGYDSAKFEVVRAHIDEAHDHDKGTVLEEHCAVAVRAYASIPICKKCGFTSLLDAVFKRHRCHFWPETFFLHNVPKKDKPGPHMQPLWLEGGDRRGQGQHQDSEPEESELPPIPLSWKPIVCDLKQKPKSKKVASKHQSSKPQQQHQRSSASSSGKSQRGDVKNADRSRQRHRHDIERQKRKASVELEHTVRRPRAPDTALLQPVRAPKPRLHTRISAP